MKLTFCQLYYRKYWILFPSPSEIKIHSAIKIPRPKPAQNSLGMKSTFFYLDYCQYWILFQTPSAIKIPMQLDFLLYQNLNYYLKYAL